MSKTYMYVFDNYIAQLVDDIDAGVHKHGVYQLSVSVDGAPHAVGPSKGDQRLGLGHLCGPNTPHSLDGCAGKQVLLWLAPQSTLARYLGTCYLDESGFGVLPESVVAGLPVGDLVPAIAAGWSGREVAPICDRFLRAIVEEPWESAADLHPAIRDAVDIIHAQPQFIISADDLASRVALSKSRLLHLFKEQMGTPLRPHLQWLRLTDVMRRAVDGESITAAAAAAGFADAPHLNRTVQQYLGLRPSDLVNHPAYSIEVYLTANE